MISDEHMNAIREARDRLRVLKEIFSQIERKIDNDVDMLPERLWWTPIEDDMHGVNVSLEEVEGHIEAALDSIAEITGEDEVRLEYKYAPLPVKYPTKEEVFAARRERAARRRNSGE